MTTEEIKVKIGCFIDAALKEEIPWSTLEKFLNKMTQSLEKSREVIKVLLRIIRVMQQPITTESEIKSETEKAHDLIENEVIEIDEIEVCENSFTKLTEDPKLGLTPQSLS